jgi:hypothetical protein
MQFMKPITDHDQFTLVFIITQYRGSDLISTTANINQSDAFDIFD